MLLINKNQDRKVIGSRKKDNKTRLFSNSDLRDRRVSLSFLEKLCKLTITIVGDFTSFSNSTKSETSGNEICSKAVAAISRKKILRFQEVLENIALTICRCLPYENQFFSVINGMYTVVLNNDSSTGNFSCTKIIRVVFRAIYEKQLKGGI